MSDQSKKYIYIAFAVILALVAVYWYGSRDNGGRTGQIRSQLDTVRTEQSRAGEAVGESKRLADSVRQTNSDIIREVDDSRAIGKSSAEVLADSKRILKQVRKRSEGREK